MRYEPCVVASHERCVFANTHARGLTSNQPAPGHRVVAVEQGQWMVRL